MINNLKRLWEPLIKSYKQFNFSQKSEIRNFKSGFTLGKKLLKFITGKTSRFLRNISIFLKKN